MDNLLQLQQPVTEGGIRIVNHFNGRLLTGSDLTRDQAAWRAASQRLGTLLGDGVARGLDVSRAPELDAPNRPVVRVAPGLAINRRGDVLMLACEAVVELTRRFEAAPADCLFGDCGTPLKNGQFVSGAGLFVLTIAPTALSEGRARTNGLVDAAVRCNTDATVDAVQFRLIEVKPAFYAGLDASRHDFRNALAYRFFGSRPQPDWLAYLLTESSQDDELLRTLGPAGLSEADVPLGMLWLTGQADLKFVDIWAVRRPLTPAPSESAVESLLQPRRPALGHAMFMQFQEQISALARGPAGLSGTTAGELCRYLPPAGLVPLEEDRQENQPVAPRFFDGLTCRGPAFINAPAVESLLRESLAYPPIDTRSAEAIWLYRVRENRMADEPAAKPYVVFTTGHMPYRADARFDLAYWDFSNFALNG